MANYQKSGKRSMNDVDDAYISSLPSPPYSEDSYDPDEGMSISSDEHINESQQSQKTFVKKSNCTNNKVNSKSKTTPTNRALHKAFMDSIKKHDFKEKGGNILTESSLKSSFANIYPNLLIKPESENSTKYKNKVRCYMCDRNVENINFKEHLFFGILECCDCGKAVADCLKFSKLFASSNRVEVGCKHKMLTWTDDPVSYLKNSFQNDSLLSHENKFFNDTLQRYLCSLKLLWDIKPWNNAIDQCRIYLSSATSCNGELKPKPKFLENNKKKKSTHLLDLPVDGRYYICKEVLEECRECYAKLNIKDFKFYVSTALITTKCRVCELEIYFVLSPPNGAKPFVEITLS